MGFFRQEYWSGVPLPSPSVWTHWNHSSDTHLNHLGPVYCFSGFPSGASGKELTCQCRRHMRRGFDPWVWKTPWRRAWQPTLVFLHGESHRQRSLAGYSPRGCKESEMIQLKRLSTQTHILFFSLLNPLRVQFEAAVTDGLRVTHPLFTVMAHNIFPSQDQTLQTTALGWSITEVNIKLLRP